MMPGKGTLRQQEKNPFNLKGQQIDLAKETKIIIFFQMMFEMATSYLPNSIHQIWSNTDSKACPLSQKLQRLQKGQIGSFHTQSCIIILIQFMKVESPVEKRKYCRTTYETRLQLIFMVQKQRQTIKSAAKVLNIKESTAKLIVSRYRTSGTIYETTQEKMEREAHNEKEKGIESIKQQENDEHIKADSKDHMSSTEKDQDNIQPQDAKLFYPFLQSIYYHPLQVPIFPIDFNQ